MWRWSSLGRWIDDFTFTFLKHKPDFLLNERFSQQHPSWIPDPTRSSNATCTIHRSMATNESSTENMLDTIDLKSLMMDSDEESYIDSVVPRTPNIITGTGYDEDEIRYANAYSTALFFQNIYVITYVPYVPLLLRLLNELVISPSPAPTPRSTEDSEARVVRRMLNPAQRKSLIEHLVQKNMRARARMLSLKRKCNKSTKPTAPSLVDVATFVKDERTVTFLKSVLTSHFLFSSLTEKSIRHMAKAMRKRVLKAREYLFRSGERNGQGDRQLFVVDRGSISLDVDSRHVQTPDAKPDETTTRTVSCVRGDIVGDDDFLLPCPRHRSAVSSSDSTLVWSLRSDVFYEYKKSDFLSSKATLENLLLKVATQLGGDAPSARRVVPKYLFEDFMLQTFPKDAEIITQGDTGHVCYILAEGDVEVSVDGKPVNMLRPGSYFGNRALLKADNTRTATCKAVGKVRCFTIDRLTFRSLMRRKNEEISRRVQRNKKDAQQTTSNIVPVPKLKASSFRVIKALGKGAYGEVVLARHDMSSEPYAIKRIDGDSEKEIAVMRYASRRALVHFTYERSCTHVRAQRSLSFKYCLCGWSYRHTARSFHSLALLQRRRSLYCAAEAIVWTLRSRHMSKHLRASTCGRGVHALATCRSQRH